MKGRSNRIPAPAAPAEDWGDGSWTVDCSCGVNFDDGEKMVNCDVCGVWVHTRCSRYVESEVSFACDKCKGRRRQRGSSAGPTAESNGNFYGFNGELTNKEETEVAQLLAELPTKTDHRPPPYKLWTRAPIEERVHVQGIPGGDPSLFKGLSSVFSSELWKCSGYVAKKFNFKYKEFPCWEEEEEGENPTNRGADLLFSLSKDVAPRSSLQSAHHGEVQKKLQKDRKTQANGTVTKKERTKNRENGSNSAKRKESSGIRDLNGIKKKPRSSLPRDESLKPIIMEDDLPVSISSNLCECDNNSTKDPPIQKQIEAEISIPKMEISQEVRADGPVIKEEAEIGVFSTITLPAAGERDSKAETVSIPDKDENPSSCLLKNAGDVDPTVKEEIMLDESNLPSLPISGEKEKLLEDYVKIPVSVCSEQISSSGKPTQKVNSMREKIKVEALVPAEERQPAKSCSKSFTKPGLTESKEKLPPGEEKSTLLESYRKVERIGVNIPSTLSDEELARLLHQELNSSPRVPRIPRGRNPEGFHSSSGGASTSSLSKCSSSGKDQIQASRRKSKEDGSRERSRGSYPLGETKRGERSSWTRTLSLDSIHSLPVLIDEIMTRGYCKTYEELCNAVLPYWKNLRKPNGDKYAFSSHAQAVLDCLRNRSQWAHLVDRGPKTNAGRKRSSPGAGSDSSGDDSESRSRNRRRLVLRGRVLRNRSNEDSESSDSE